MVTDNQIDLFHPHDPRSLILDEVLNELHDPRLHADVSRLRECLTRRDTINMRRADLRRLEAEATRDQFHLDMEFASVRKRLQYARAIPLISDKYAELTAKPIRPRHAADSMPLPPRVGGPCEMPRLQGEGKSKKRAKKCFMCKSTDHLIAECPNRRVMYACAYCGSDNHGIQSCLIRRVSAMAPRHEEPSHRPRWCGKCLRFDAQHDEIDCPMYELCRKCGERGHHLFLRRHTCPVPRSPTPTNDVDTDVYDYVGSD